MAKLVQHLLLSTLILSILALPSFAADWQPKQSALTTRWAKDVTPDKVHPEYPRPQMVREAWQNLNGLWDYAIAPKAAQEVKKYAGQILVPFPAESALSGVMEPVGPENRLWYRRTFTVPDKWKDSRLLLHFGAVDWETQVWLNGKKIGEHRGGYDPFSFEITKTIKNAGEQELVIAVADPTDASTQPRGKQVRRPGGIFYTPSTGIWQTVWLEPVPKTYIRGLKLTSNVDTSEAIVQVDAVDLPAKYRLAVQVKGAGKSESVDSKREARVKIADAKLWTPDTPHLYDLQVSLYDGDKLLDSVGSYIGLRKIEIGKDPQGVTRLLLNGKFVFQYGPLDQGFWPDGLYSPPTDAALRYDLEITKQLGFNMVRKHVKVESARWYHHCDKLGLLVWQDMPSGDKHIGPSDPDIVRSEESARQFEAEWKAIMDALHNAPSIIMWVPFNEGWGQYDTARIVAMTKEHDPTRLVNNASGWSDRKVGDVHDAHIYPGPGMPAPESDRAVVLGEFGGLGLPVEGHTWLAKGNWGYVSYKNEEALTDAYLQLMARLRILIGKGLSAAVYTQTTDVETEVNGLLTYDRAIVKIPAETLAKVHGKLYLPPPTARPLVSASHQQPAEWRYTTEKPTGEWFKPEYKDADWKTGQGGFGTAMTPGTSVKTEWKSSDIWIRREFKLEAPIRGEPMLLIHHDEDATVYINGVEAARLSGYTTDYATAIIRGEAAKTIRQGKNTIAIHCHQETGGQYIDAGLVDVVEAE